MAYLFGRLCGGTRKSAPVLARYANLAQSATLDWRQEWQVFNLLLGVFMTDTASTAPKCAVLKFPLDPVRLHAKATNALQRTLLEMHSEKTSYSVALGHLAAASNAVGALALIDASGHRTEASNEPEEPAGPGAAPEPAEPTTAVLAPPSIGYRKAYVEKLNTTICKYLNATETEELATALVKFSEGIMARRYAPGLNDAVYDLFARFALKGV